MELKPIKCETCLSSDRELVCLTKLKLIIDEIQLPWTLSPNAGVCWECQCIMKKIYKFRMQVNEAQSILARNCEDKIPKSLSSLANSTNKNYDFKFIYHCDPLVTVENEIKAEPILIKQEDKIDFDDRYEDIDEKPLSIFTDRIKPQRIQNKIKKKKTLQSNKTLNKTFLKKQNAKNIDQPKKSIMLKEEYIDLNKDYLVDKKDNSKKVLKEKFDTIIYTEEEMLQFRKEKQNQANFKKIPFKCNTCVIGFFTKEKYDVHMKKIHDESIGKHTCSVCQAKFPTTTAVSKHRTKHYLQYHCKLCDYKVSSSTAAINHGRAKHLYDGMGKIHCQQCAFLARSSKELKEHTRSEHSLVCKECGVTFKGMNTLRSHQIRIHASKREFSCEICLRTFNSKSRLESHSARHSSTIAKSLSYCAKCNIQYKDIQVYRNHLRNSVNHVQNRISCPDCDKKFASRAYWSKHYNYFYHLRKSRYKCDDCTKMFMSEWKLKLHKQTHHGLPRSRDHQCADCDKKFYTRATLLTHSHLHAASRAFMCSQCGATFRQRAALYTHVRRLHT